MENPSNPSQVLFIPLVALTSAPLRRTSKDAVCGPLDQSGYLADWYEIAGIAKCEQSLLGCRGFDVVEAMELVHVLAGRFVHGLAIHYMFNEQTDDKIQRSPQPQRFQDLLEGLSKLTSVRGARATLRKGLRRCCPCANPGSADDVFVTTPSHDSNVPHQPPLTDKNRS
jgi:hypothetical protein